jgi:hypothetical protein
MPKKITQIVFDGAGSLSSSEDPPEILKTITTGPQYAAMGNSADGGYIQVTESDMHKSAGFIMSDFAPSLYSEWFLPFQQLRGQLTVTTGGVFISTTDHPDGRLVATVNDLDERTEHVVTSPTDTVNHVVRLTREEYDALETKDSATFYIIDGGAEGEYTNYMAVPDYANRETVSRISVNNGTWTADRSGFISCRLQADITTIKASHFLTGKVSINGTIAAGYTVAPAATAGTALMLRLDPEPLPVRKGDVIQFLITAASATANDPDPLPSLQVHQVYCYFIPPKWESFSTPVISENFENYLAVPDYANADSAAVTIAEETLTTSDIGRYQKTYAGFTADRSGFLLVRFGGTAPVAGLKWQQIWINGRIAAMDGVTQEGGYAQQGYPVPVAKGDVVTGFLDYGTLAGTYVIRISAIYIPPRFIKRAAPVVVEPVGSYSLEEVMTNETWIDGKPVYKRTVQTGALGGGAWAPAETRTILSDITSWNVARWIGSVEAMTADYQTVTLGHTVNRTQLIVRNSSSSTWTDGFVTLSPSWFTIRYTKTTD